MQVREARRLRQLRERRAVEEVVGRRAVRALAEPRGRVRLRIEVDDERPLTGLGQARGEVDRGRRLADAALLVRDRVDRRRAPARFYVSAKRTLPGHARPAWETGRESARPCGGRAARAAALGSLRRAVRPRARPRRVRRRARPTARPRRRSHERQAPLRRDRRRRERLRDAQRRTRRLVLLRAAAARPARSGSRSDALRNSHFRPFASSSVTSRSGSAAASGIPGAPPPEPTSTIGPSTRARASSAAQRVLEQNAPRLVEVADRGQPASGDEQRGASRSSQLVERVSCTGQTTT